MQRRQLHQRTPTRGAIRQQPIWIVSIGRTRMILLPGAHPAEAMGARPLASSCRKFGGSEFRLHHFYRATRMYARYAASCHEVSVCPSVRLSVTLVYCVETAELIVKQLTLDCSLGTLGYGHQTRNIISLGDLHLIVGSN